MVTRQAMLDAALRYDTAMSRAMLRALGPDARRYRAMRWCFENHGSPMR